MATGNSSSAKSARVKLQLRDKKGRWIEMGGGVKWYSPNLGKFMFGTAVDATPTGLAVVEVKIPTSTGEKITTVEIAPSQLEKIKSKATIGKPAGDSISPELSKPNSSVQPPVEKNNELFEKIHKNKADHPEPFGPDYEQAPDGAELEEGDMVISHSEGTIKKALVTGFDPKTKKPLLKKEYSSSQGFMGESQATDLKYIAKVFKAVPTSPTNEGDDKKAKIDPPVPAPETVKPTPGQVTITENEDGPSTESDNYLVSPKGKPSVMKKAEAEPIAENSEKTEQEKFDAKLNMLLNVAPGTRMLSEDEKTVNLVKQDDGSWTEDGTNKNFSSTQVAEQFSGQKNVSFITPVVKPKKTGFFSSDMGPEEFKANLGEYEQNKLNEELITSPYYSSNPAFANFPGYNFAEEEAIIDYVQDSTGMNVALRTNSTEVKYHAEGIAGIDSILNKSLLDKPITVYRGFRARPEVFDSMVNLGAYTDLGYSSTSVNQKVADDWIKGSNYSEKKAVTVKMNLPAGFKAHKVDYSVGTSNGWGIGSFDEEEEVIIPRNTMFKVISMEPNADKTKWTATVEPVLTADNSIEGTTNAGTNNTTGSNEDPSGTESKTEDTSGTDNGGKSKTLPDGGGSDSNPNGGTSPGGSTAPESSEANGTGSEGPEDGLVTEEPAAEQELGKIYSDTQGQYMAGTDGQKFRKGDTVSYTKKGETQEGKIIALYEGVKSARVEWPDGSNSIKKINTLKSVNNAPEANVAPTTDKPVATPANINYDTPEESYSKAPFDKNLPMAVEDIPIGSVLKLVANPDFALAKIGDNQWQSKGPSSGPSPDSSVKMAIGMSSNGKPSYNIYMPKDASPIETVSPSVNTVDAPELSEADISTAPEVSNFGEELPTIEKTEVVGNLEVTSNENNQPGSFLIKSTDGSSVATAIDSLKAGDKVYPVGTDTKPYGTHSNYGTKSSFINVLNPAGVGTVIKNDPNKPYIQVEGSDGKTYFPSKNFISVKQTDELDKLIAANSKDQAVIDAQSDISEEIAAPEELAGMETAAAAATGPVDVSSWKKLNNSTGSNPGGEYEAPDGSRFFIKQSKSDLHAKNEVLASDIYQAAGVNSLELGYANVDGAGKLGTVAPMLSDAKDNFQDKLSDPEYKKEFQKGWAVDAWLGNWDVVGLSFDNALTDGAGKAIRVDPGGALLFRAMGSPKTDEMFSDSVTEWDSMRTDPNKYQSYTAFGDMTDQQVKDSVALVAAFTDQMIDNLVDKQDFDEATAAKLKSRLKARRDDLIKRANELPGKNISAPLAQWEIDLLNGGSTTEDDLFDSMDENEFIFEDDSTPVLSENQEALEILKKKLQEQDTPQFKKEESLAEWEKELLYPPLENKDTFDIANSKPGTVFVNDKGSDAIVGKYHNEVAYGVSVKYTKKGEIKTGTVSNIMVNQQSAKVVWPDGSSSIIKGSQLETVASSTTEEATPKVSQYNNQKWNTSVNNSAADLPIGTLITLEHWPNAVGWKKVEENKWVSYSTDYNEEETLLEYGSGSYSDADFDSVKEEDYYTIYTPKNAQIKEPEINSESKIDSNTTTKPFNKINKIENLISLPNGTEISSSTELLYTKVENGWQSDNFGTIYSNDSIFELHNYGQYSVSLPVGKTWWNTHENKLAEELPIGTSIINGKWNLSKNSPTTWKSTTGFIYSNNEINDLKNSNLASNANWVLHLMPEEKQEEKETVKESSILSAVEAAMFELSEHYYNYTTQNEEYASWYNFANAYDDGLIDFEENNIFIGEKTYKIQPITSNSPTQFVQITDENEAFVSTIPVSALYGEFDKYLAKTNLENFFTALADDTSEKEKVKEPEIVENKVEEVPETTEQPWTAQIGVTAQQAGIGSLLTLGTTKLVKTEDDTWATESGAEYDNALIENLKDAGWSANIIAGSTSSVKIEEESKPVKELWSSSSPKAENMPTGTTIADSQDAVTFKKNDKNQWVAVKMPSVAHSNETMDELKGTTWYFTLPENSKIAEPKPEVPVEKSTGAGMTATEFTNKFNTYLSEIENSSWSQTKGTELPFEIADGTKFIFKPHPFSSEYSKSFQIVTEDGTVVKTESDLALNYEDYMPIGFSGLSVYDAATAHASSNTTSSETFDLDSGSNLGEISYDDFVKVPAGTKIHYMLSGKVYGSFLKNTNNTWRYKETSKEKPSHKTETNDDFRYLMENNKEAAGNYIIVAPEAPVTSEEPIEVKKTDTNLFANITVDEEILENYPVGTTVKYDQTSYNNSYKGTYFVKQEDGTWNKYVKTANTVSQKESNILTKHLNGVFNSWYTNTASVSIPGPNAVMLGNGEHAYIGDVVQVNSSMDTYTVDKINKSYISVIASDGSKLKIPAKKLYKTTGFGVKKTETMNSASQKYDTSTIDPLSAWVESIKAEKAIKDKLLNFAGASGADYDTQGLGLNISPNAATPKNLGLSVIEVDPNSKNHPFFGQPKPVMPESPDEYPSFEESVLDNLPKWNSAEWLKKVEARYLENPNKKFESVQKSTQWNKIEEVLKGNEGYKAYLDQLLKNKYVDQDLYDMAESAIKAQEIINKPLKKAHQENIQKEKAEYEAKKALYFAEYDEKVAAYNKTFEEWSKVNVTAKTVKKMPVLPTLSTTPFTGGPADWTKAHPGTYAVQTVMDSIRNDNVLGRFGLAAAIDGDKIEETAVTFNRVLDTNGKEKFEITFKLTNAYGAYMKNKLKADPSVSQSNGIYYNKKTNMIGKPEDQLAKLVGKPGNSNFVNSGTRFEFKDPATNAQIAFQHASQEGQNVSVNHNAVQILMDTNSTPAELQLVLENLGIDAKPSTAGALRVVAENKLITYFSGDSNWGNENFSGEQRQKALDKVKKNFNITVDDVVVEADANGRFKFYLTDAKVEEFMKVSPVQEFKHSVYAGEDLDVWESILSGANPGLVSNYFRGNNGIGELQSSTGMSPDKDMSVGSGAGIFITPHGNKETSAPYYNWVGIDRKAVMRRLDFWGNIGDNYGKNDKGAKTPFQLMKTQGNFHEVMPRDGIPVSDFTWVTLASEQSKKKLIQRLSDKGIFMINGLPLEKFILTNHETITPLPGEVNKMGTDIAPSGAAAEPVV